MDRRSLAGSLLSLFLSTLMAGAVSAGTGDATSSDAGIAQESEEKTDILATAFGYQNDESSTVLVKTFDLKTGTLLSENSFTLPGVEETSFNNGVVVARILAGGARIVGQGELALTLRVYEAHSGRYLHNVNLNVAADAEAGVLPTPIIGRVASRGIVRLTSGAMAEPANEEAPMFFIRAVDPSNEHVVWQTEFESAESAIGKVERIRYRLLPGESPVVKDQKYDFQVRMYNHRTGDLMWKDASSLLVKPAGSPSREDETLGKVLPAWPSEEHDDASAATIRATTAMRPMSEWRL